MDRAYMHVAVPPQSLSFGGSKMPFHPPKAEDDLRVGLCSDVLGAYTIVA